MSGIEYNLFKESPGWGDHLRTQTDPKPSTGFHLLLKTTCLLRPSHTWPLHTYSAPPGVDVGIA